MPRDLFMPLVRGPNEDRDSFELTVIARLAPGVTIEAARADLERDRRRSSRANIRKRRAWASRIESVRGMGRQRLAAARALGAHGGRRVPAADRVREPREHAARALHRPRPRACHARGARRDARVASCSPRSRNRCCSACSARAVGLGMAFGVVRLLRAFDPGDIPASHRGRRSTVAVLAVTLGAALITSVVTGLAPALRTPYHDIVAALREGERSVVGNRRGVGMRGALVSVEVALSLMLLVGAGLLVRSFGAILDVDRGFETENRVMFNVSLPSPQNEADVAAIERDARRSSSRGSRRYRR